jgi:hypothetical protein
MSVVAYSGEVEFDGCFWDDLSGWRVRWRLVGVPGSLEKANPMKKFTKRRGDRTGTRFQAAIQPVSFGEPYDGEVMLAAWSDSTSGWSATFEFPEQPDFTTRCLRRAKDRIGTRFMMALAEIDHEENVIDQQQRERVEQAQSMGKGLLLLSNKAAMLMKNHMFHEWLRENVKPGDWNELSANGWLKNRIGITSKAELDDKRNSRAIQEYLKIVRDFEEYRDGPTRSF